MQALPRVGWYFGCGVLLRWYYLQKHGSRFPIWQVFAIETLAAVALEPPGIKMGLWEYYGYHGLRFFEYPIWWPIVGGTCGVVAGTLVYKLQPYLTGWRVLAIPVIVPMGVVATYWAVGWPMFNLLNKEAPHALVHVGTAVTTAQAIFVVWICSIVTGHHEYRRQRKADAATPTHVGDSAEHPAPAPTAR